MDEEPLVKTAATVFQEMCYSYRDSLSAGIICAGWDQKLGGQVIYHNQYTAENKLKLEGNNKKVDIFITVESLIFSCWKTLSV